MKHANVSRHLCYYMNSEHQPALDVLWHKSFHVQPLGLSRSFKHVHYQNWVIFPPSMTWCDVFGTSPHHSHSSLLSDYHTNSSRRRRNIPATLLVVKFLASCQRMAWHIRNMGTKWCSLVEENDIWFLHCGRGLHLIGILSFDAIQTVQLRKPC
jgi:hypothetical protein